MSVMLLQQLYKDDSKNLFNELDSINQILFDGVLTQYTLTMADALLACRIIVPVYPIMIDREVFTRQLNDMTTTYLSRIAQYGETRNDPQIVKHKREYGQRETTDDDTVKSTDDATTDTSTDNTYFDPSPRYDVEPTRTSQSDIGQRQRTDDIDRKHTEKAHTDVEYDEPTDWDMVKQINDFRSHAIDLLIQWLTDAVTTSREWGVYGV